MGEVCSRLSKSRGEDHSSPTEKSIRPVRQAQKQSNDPLRVIRQPFLSVLGSFLQTNFDRKLVHIGVHFLFEKVKHLCLRTRQYLSKLDLTRLQAI